MGLGINAITSWIVMKNIFLQKYQDYCRGQDTRKENIFRMSQGEDEPLEDHLEQFQFCLKKPRQNSINPQSLKIIFLRGITKDCIDALNLMVGGDITQE